MFPAPMTNLPGSVTPSDDTGSSKEIRLLERQNPEYSFYSDEWEMLSVLYEGGQKLRANVDKFLVRRPKELYDVFYERVRRLTYQDMLQACVSWHLSKMFQREPVVNMKSGNATDAADFIMDCDRSGKPFNQFSRDMLEKMMLFRRAFVLIDKPKPNSVVNIKTRADEKAARLHIPYLVLFDPRNVINWGLNPEDGMLDWIVIKTVDQFQPGPFDKVKVKTNWWIFDRQRYYRYQFEKDVPEGSDSNQFMTANQNLSASSGDRMAKLVDTGDHALSQFNQVPVEIIELPMDLWHANRAFLHLLEHVDTMNGYSWKLFMANHPQLVIFTDEDVVSKTLSESGFLQFGINDKIEWLEPKGSSFQESRLHLATMRQEIYRAFHLQAQAKDSSATADGSSGYSKEVEMAPAVDILNALGDYTRDGMQRVLLAVKKAGNMSPDTYPDVNGFQFEVHPTIATITKYQAAADAGIIQKSATLEVTISTDVAMDLVDGKNDELKEKIKKEIAAAPTIPNDVAMVPGQGNQQPGQGGTASIASQTRQEFQTRETRAQAANIIRAESAA